MRYFGKYKKIFLLLENCFSENQSKVISPFCLNTLLGRQNQHFLNSKLNQQSSWNKVNFLLLWLNQQSSQMWKEIFWESIRSFLFFRLCKFCP